MVLRSLHLCSGIGAFELALTAAGVRSRTVCHVERDAYAAATLRARMEDQTLGEAPIWADLCDFDPGPWRGRVDLVTGGLPCQPFSRAGSQRGMADDRHVWPYARDVIEVTGCQFVFLEQVVDAVEVGWLDEVAHDLSSLGFDLQWSPLAASTVGFPHHRNRLWVFAFDPSLADPDHPELSEDPGDFRVHQPPDCCPVPPPPGDPRWDDYIAAGGPRPLLRRSTHGPPAGLVDRLHVLGNALIPEVAATALTHLAHRGRVPIRALSA